MFVLAFATQKTAGDSGSLGNCDGTLRVTTLHVNDQRFEAVVATPGVGHYTSRQEAPCRPLVPTNYETR